MRICDILKTAENDQTYREFMHDGFDRLGTDCLLVTEIGENIPDDIDHVGLDCLIDKMTAEDLNEFLDHIEYLWDK